MDAEASPPEEHLLQRSLAGDAQAFDALFARYTSALRNRIARLLPSDLNRRVSVSDVLQEVRLVALRRRTEFEDRGPGSFRNWVLTIADLKIKEIVRKHVATAKRAAGREVSRGQRVDTAHFVARGPSPSQAAIAVETAALIRKAMQALAPHEREVLQLAREQRLPLREVALRIGRSHEATKKLYGKALLRLRQIYEGLGGKSHG